MITLRPAQERGRTHQGWLESLHTFSFDQYQDPAHMGFRNLRVINEDRVAAGKGFPMHAHRDMEILTVVISGSLAHEDDAGGEGVIQAGGIQRITAGRGIRHSEYNPDERREVHFFQIWFFPERKGLEPGYQSGRFSLNDPAAPLTLLASPTERQGALMLHQDVSLYFGSLEHARNTDFTLERGRHGWLQIIDGTLICNGKSLRPGDGAAISAEPELAFSALDPCRFLFFDLN